MNLKTHNKRLRLAVVGAGLGASPHFLSLEELAGEVDVAWVHARDAQRLAHARIPAGAIRTSRFEDILEDTSVQAVLVLTPANAHLEVVERAARAGKHVLVEKPLEADLARATALVDACEKHGVMLGIMLQHRLREAAVGLAGLIRSGEFGELVSALASVRWWRPQSYYDEPGRGTLARDGGGVLMTQAIHTLDLMLSLIGLPETVIGIAGTSHMHQMECEDNAAALLRYAGGAVATVQATTAAYPGFPERVELNFTKGSATLEAGVMRAAFIDGRSVSLGTAQGSGGGANPMAFDHAAHRAVIADFVQAVSTGGTPAITGRSALDVQRVIAAIMASSKNGGSVLLSSVN
ncbi:MAG: Gfo/Idh/MocA family oxidoreductase [Pseudomonadota bacterium]